jgi:hypothetical protein
VERLTASPIFFGMALPMRCHLRFTNAICSSSTAAIATSVVSVMDAARRLSSSVAVNSGLSKKRRQRNIAKCAKLLISLKVRASLLAEWCSPNDVVIFAPLKRLVISHAGVLFREIARVTCATRCNRREVSANYQSRP